MREGGRVTLRVTRVVGMLKVLYRRAAFLSQVRERETSDRARRKFSIL